MNRWRILSILVVLPACSGGDSNPNNGNTDASPFDSSTAEASGDDGQAPDSGSTNDGVAPGPDGAIDSGGQGDADAGGGNADANIVVDTDASDGGCPTSWFVAPVVDPSIAVPDGGGGVLLHAVGAGTQNYVCVAAITDAGAPTTWTLVAPNATLSDCHALVIGHHFASEGGAGFPEWQTDDGTYVIGQKHLPTFTPDGGAGSIPWLLLRAVDAGGSGALSRTAFIERLNTDGGTAPSGTCTPGDMTQVGYTADYYFFGQ